MARSDSTTNGRTAPDSDDADAHVFKDLRGETVPFAGLTRHADIEKSDIPAALDYGDSMAWWAADLREATISLTPDGEGVTGKETIAGALPDRGLHTLIPELPRVIDTEAGWKDPMTGELHETAKHTALVDPERLRAYHAGAENLTLEDCLAHIPTRDYTVIPPAAALEPLAEFLRDQGHADHVFGEFRVAEAIGGGVSADIYVNGEHIISDVFPDDREPVVAGMEVEWDFKGGRAFRVRGTMMDTRCLNSMRGITEWVRVKHVGDLSRVDFYELYEQVWGQVADKLDPLADAIASAAETRLSVGDLPTDFVDVADELNERIDINTPLSAFYQFAGLPAYLAVEAGRNARANATDPFEPTFWTINRGATFAITHYARGDIGGGSIEDYHRTANDLLFNPVQVRDRVVQAYEETCADLTNDGQQTLAGGSGDSGGRGEVTAAFGSVDAMKEQYEERAEEIRELAAEVEQ